MAQIILVDGFKNASETIGYRTKVMRADGVTQFLKPYSELIKKKETKRKKRALAVAPWAAGRATTLRKRETSRSVPLPAQLVSGVGGCERGCDGV